MTHIASHSVSLPVLSLSVCFFLPSLSLIGRRKYDWGTTKKVNSATSY